VNAAVFIQEIKRQFPDLVLIAAGDRTDEVALAAWSARARSIDSFIRPVSARPGTAVCPRRPSADFLESKRRSTPRGRVELARRFASHAAHRNGRWWPRLRRQHCVLAGRSSTR